MEATLRSLYTGDEWPSFVPGEARSSNPPKEAEAGARAMAARFALAFVALSSLAYAKPRRGAEGVYGIERTSHAVEEAWRRSRGLVKDVADAYEARGKGETFRGLREKAVEEGKTLWLVSWHADSAKDHEPWQGKIYSDESAPVFGMRTLQWLMGAPVYMLTRPNCRHYVRAISGDEAKEGADRLLDRFRMRRAVGERGGVIQTPGNYASKERLELYEDRLKLHRYMYAESGDGHLLDAIVKDRLLITSLQG